MLTNKRESDPSVQIRRDVFARMEAHRQQLRPRPTKKELLCLAMEEYLARAERVARRGLRVVKERE